MLRLVWVLPGVILLGWMGCGEKPAEYGGELPKQVYGRVISLSPSITELMAMLNLEKILIGRTAVDDSPQSIVDIPIVANPRPDFERIMAIRPDLVLADKHLLNPADEKRLRELNLNLKIIEIDSVEDWKRTVLELGNLFLEQSLASRKVDEVDEAIARAKSDPIEPKPKVLVAMGGSQPWVAGTDSFQADVVRNAGGEYVGPKADKFVQVTPEQIIAWNPDIVFVSDDPSMYYKDKAWSLTEAGKRKRIIGVKANLILRPGARVADLIDSLYGEMKRQMSGGRT
ncbi:MAG TPA: helical backbone metal receptor [Fimbriimonadales bacterium]|nr:helical backbone metal receptor [Fimbriimonadales bacterium]